MAETEAWEVRGAGQIIPADYTGIILSIVGMPKHRA